MAEGLAGLRVASFESRRSDQMASLIRRHGGEPLSAPALREAPLANQEEALAFGTALLAGGCDVLVLLTGVGTQMLVQVLSTRWPREDVIGALSRVDRICRGPKPVSALRALGLQPSLVVPEPNTWHDLLQLLDRERPVSGKRVAVQEYGTRNQALLDALAERGAAVTPVPLYGWTLPEDTAPLRSAIARALAGELDAALFTSAVQIEHLFRLAAEEGHREALRDALSQQMVVASIGPITTEALALEGITADVTPEHPKMGHLVSALAQQAEAVLLRKRVGRS